jgi:hypothetical protein
LPLNVVSTQNQLLTGYLKNQPALHPPNIRSPPYKVRT